MSDVKRHTVLADNGRCEVYIIDGYKVKISTNGCTLQTVYGSAALLLENMARELDAARVVIATARAMEAAGTAPPEIVAALERHRGLVSDVVPPSAWATT